MNWYVIEKEYVKYLNKQDSRVGKIEYGDKLKPYIGIVLEIHGYNYYVPVSSAKEKHYKINEHIDFLKVKRGEKILSVLNMNNMIPIKQNCVKILRYEELDKYRKFNSLNEKQQYIELLEIELKIINKKQKEIIENAKKLYELVEKYPESKLAKRSCNFKMLELKADEYKKKNN